MPDVANAQSRTYAGSTQQERQSRRRAALTEAAFDLLAAGGVERVTAIGVCTRARLNNRYFSESFSDRDELLGAVFEKVTADGLQLTETLLAESGEPDISWFRTLLAAGIDFMTADPRRGALLIESQATASLRVRRAEMIGLVASLLAADQARRLGHRAPPETELLLISHTIFSGALETLTRWLRGDLDVSRETLIDVLARMLINATALSTADGDDQLT